MPLDPDTVKFIVDQNERLENNMKEYMDLTGTATRGAIKAEVDRIDQMDKIRNGKIANNEEEIDIVKDETSFGRWAQRNKKFSIPAVFVLLIGLIIGVILLGPEKVIEKAAGVEIEINPKK